MSNMPSRSRTPIVEGFVGDGMVRVGAMMPMPGLLREHGVDPVALLAEFSLEPAYFEDPDNTIPLAAMGRIYKRCAAITECPHFGLLIGQRDSGSALGAVGFLMRNSPNVRTALENLAHHFRVHNRDAIVGFVEDGAVAVLSYTVLEPGIEGCEQILDMAIAIGFKVMRDLCGPSWLPIEVHLAHVPQLNLKPFREFFRAPLRFNATESALMFDRSWLDKPVSDADPLLRLMMSRRVNAIESHLGDDLVKQIREILYTILPLHRASKAEVARRAGLSTRSLSRFLAAAGTTFDQLRDEVRYSLAAQLLERTQMSATEIAEHLGYANASAFTRAFFRWSDMNPIDWRASRRRSSPKRSRRTAGN